MDKDIKQFIKRALNIKLSKEEKSAIKQSVLNFISQNPASRSYESVRPDIKPRLSYWSNIFLMKLSFSSSMAILLLFSIFLSGGIAVGAEKSLPGDLLYPVKIDLNEEVRGWLATSEEAKTDWEIKRAERRLEEAEELASKGSLDADTTAKIEANFDSHADKVRERIEKFNSKENFTAAASVSLNFENALRAHDKILSKLAEKETKIKDQVKPIRVKVRSEVRKSEIGRQEMDMRAKGETQNSIKAKSSDDINEDLDLDSDIDLNLSPEGGNVRNQGRLKANIGL